MFFALIRSVLFEKRPHVNQSTTISFAILMQENSPFVLYSVEICHKIRTFYCLISYREGLGTSLLIMGLATIDPHSQKEHTEIHKIPKFGVNQASLD